MPDDSDDLLSELFGDVIFSYTDDQAVSDGVLIPFLLKDRDTRHRITSNAYHELKHHYDVRGYDYDESHYLGLFLNELLPIAPAAIQEYRSGGILKTDYDFRVVNKEGSEVLWYLPNELGGVTIMKPNDY